MGWEVMLEAQLDLGLELGQAQALDLLHEQELELELEEWKPLPEMHDGR